MTQAKLRFTTLEEYAALDPSDLPEGQFELVNGEIIELPSESDPNVEIAGFLAFILTRSGVGLKSLSPAALSPADFLI
jgi:Uma2 family endonuclease